MSEERSFEIEVPDKARCVIRRSGGRGLSISFFADDPSYSFEDQVVPLGKFLKALGLTADDCLKALSEASH